MSVNRKNLEVACQLPRELSACEIPIRDAVAKRIARGRVSVTVSLTGTTGEGTSVIDFQFARQVGRELARLKAELALSGTLDVATVLQVPGVIRAGKSPQENLLPVVLNALNAALDGLCAMRAKEGGALKADVLGRVDALQKLIADIAEHAPRLTAVYRDALKARIDAANLEAPVDEARLASEVALFAERSDVQEEVTRLRSHLDQFREKLALSEPSGRALEFIVQEIGRELNTLGAKAGDAALSRIVVDARVELDRIREQISNLE